MNVPAFKERIAESGAKERKDAQSSANNAIDSVPPKKFGFGRKCLIVFAAALVASTILQQLPGASNYTQLDKAWGVDPSLHHTMPAEVARYLGGATGLFLMAMVIAAFVRGSAGAITGVVLVGVWAYFSAYGTLHNPNAGASAAISRSPEQTSVGPKSIQATSGKRHEATNSFRWKPAGSEYSVGFPKVPEISEVRGRGQGNDITYLQATYSSPDTFEQAQFFKRPVDMLVTKEFATVDLLNWASANGIEYADVHFNNSDPNDLVATVKGTKPISTKGGNIIIAYRGETHYGRRSIMITLVGAPTTKDPTPEGLAFLQSIRLENEP